MNIFFVIGYGIILLVLIAILDMLRNQNEINESQSKVNKAMGDALNAILDAAKVAQKIHEEQEMETKHE